MKNSISILSTKKKSLSSPKTFYGNGNGNMLDNIMKETKKKKEK